MSDTSTLAVLRSEKDIDTAWLEDLLKQRLKSNIEVISWTSNPPATKSGFLSEMCFVNVRFKRPDHPTEEKSLAVKFAPSDKNILEFIKNGNLARKEIEFYKYVQTNEFQLFCERSGVKHPVPDVYWANMEEDLLTLVMHDLRTDGYRVDIQPEGSSLEQVKMTLKSIAVIHACGVATIKKHGREYLDVRSGDFLDGYLKVGIEKEIEMFTGTRTAETLRAINSLRDQGIKTRYPLFETLIHGDLWMGNVMFSADNTNAIIIDWQFASVDNPVCDILSLLFMSSHPVVYEQHLNEVLVNYWQSLTEALEKNGVSVESTFQDLVECVEEMWMYGFMFLTASWNDLLSSNLMTAQRAQHAIHFFEKKNTFSKFLQLHGKEIP
ncbi:uncharacterized protein LOC122255176 [Penaeus japonicus]|uniref:uncharacterized protein LOC122255176 n=1 Tax=Penaeus japonicus TaxID=27405 RepID=UPI001C70D321|nr:uncharacterized protein LOC122255176 [Penaeus japonicus]XP_042875023.1 uncharacterized protein LOC122255176 [Penaeus japonicus]